MVAFVAIGATTVGAGAAQAAGTKVTPTIKLSPAKPKINKKTKKPVAVKFSTVVAVAKPDGSREDVMKTIDLTMPKNLVADAKGFKTCSLELLKANKPSQCPAGSLLGDSLGIVDAVPLFTTPLHADGKIYLTGKSAGTVKVAIYADSREVPTAHGVVEGVIKQKKGGVAKVHWDVPRIPTAPGLPDAGNLSLSFNWTARGPQGTLFRATKPCKGGWKASTRLTFTDGSSSSGNVKAAC
jgi:hypothetical protein